mgnify:CR=1 FL=1
MRVASRAGVGIPLGLWLRLRLGLGLGLGLGSSRDDLDHHFRRLQPIDLNLDLVGTTHLDHESRLHYKQCLWATSTKLTRKNHKSDVKLVI